MHYPCPRDPHAPGELPEDEMAYYRSLQEKDAARELPDWLKPRNDKEMKRLKWNVSAPRGEGVDFLRGREALRADGRQWGHLLSVMAGFPYPHIA